jgi:SAM-dependent methyltransferase
MTFAYPPATRTAVSARTALISLSPVSSIEAASRKYDEIADRYEEMFFYVADLGQRLVDFANPPAGSRALDIGAGRGAVARAALARGCTVTAIDASPRMIARLVADHPDVAAHVMDAAALDFPDDSFDLVTAGFVVQILPDPAQVLAELRRVLGPGGTIALSLETQSIGRLQWLHDLTIEFFSPAGAAPSPASDPGPLACDRLDELLAAAGFVSRTREAVEIPLTLTGPSALWDWLTPRGLTEAVQLLPPDRAEAFHQRFLAGAQTMRSNGSITLDFGATLHRAVKPAD